MDAERMKNHEDDLYRISGKKFSADDSELNPIWLQLYLKSEIFMTDEKSLT
jgi:hypothetical protein